MSAALMASGAPAALPAPVGPRPSTARRFDAGASATVQIRARIVRGAASVGARRGPPVPGMTPRAATVHAADGRPVAALIYDFE